MYGNRRTDYEMHGESHTRLYRVWNNLVRRCENTNDGTYQKYGAKGITLCEEWRNSFVAFRDWAYATGYDKDAPPGQCTIDRIDNSKGYCPENCRWADRIIQQNNRSVNHRLEINGESHTIAEWSRISGNPFNRIYGRLRDGWDAESAVFKPVEKRYSHCQKSDSHRV